MNRKLIAAIGITASLAAGGTTLAAAGPAQAATNWGVIAFDNSGRTSYAVDYPSQRSAINAAKARCGSHCGYFAFYNSCGAIAYTNDRRHWHWASGYRAPQAAQNAARSELPYRGYVARWACTTRPR
ncbi:DUF4189 domain-containing protein [Gordonia bronchialis]|uniref:DUF4189 domain-containing protein n=1 Tax=Gordonia bronchialis TaxID=2054 RepID=UPI001CBB19AF|nr:DUF4189 domain-containing protein [Gordonia bronchialis]UAK37814.1 DUF4189 domain-containing protein [Gordonia bronchialis]